ncbi:MAG: alpha-amylase family glycosyl hydrolase [Acutalibacteraceae bacterium]|nr:alpha-amylase family glycosyl hydrolase [Acutalibacteraceae bacterium]
MNEKKRFGKKVIALALTAAMASTMTAFAASSSASAVTTTTTSSQATSTAVQSTKDASTFSWDNATVYFLLTDRFNNGDTSNDHSYGRGLKQDGTVASYDNYAAFQGGDFKGITQKIEDGYFENLGVNAIWMSAPYEQIHGYCVGCDGDSFAHYSYHGYYVLDYTEADANFGTKEEFKELVDTAHEHGIRIVLDIVMNHAGYNTIQDMSEYSFGELKSGWESYYYNHSNINNTTYHSYINYDASSSVWGNWWGSDWIRCGLPGYTSGSGDIEGSLAGLPDFKTGSSTSVSLPKVLQTKWNKEGTYSTKAAKYGTSNTVTGYISDWLAEWVREYGVDGFRCDTAKHVETSAWKTLKTKCVAALKEWKAANPDKALDDEEFWMTGECFGHKAEKSYYYTEGGFDSMINFEFAPAVNSSNIPSASSVESVYSRYASSINSDPDFNVLSYIASHDTTLASGDRKYAGSFLLMLPGGVQIYYGDETNRPLVNSSFANVDPGAGHQFRSFMNWSSQDSATLSHWQKVGTFRNNHVAVGAGQHTQISSYSSSTGYTFARTYDDGEVVDSIVATLFAPANTSISVDVSSVWANGTIVTNAYDGSTATVTNGKATFNSGANGTILIEGPQSSISMSLKSSTGSTKFEGSCTLTLSLNGADSAQVTIDNGTPFTATNGQSFTIGENTAEGGTVSVKLTASNSEETVERTYVYSKKDPNATISVYFDNTSYNWSSVYAYIYDESGSSVIENAAWPGQAMTYNTSLGLYEVEVPEDLWGDNAQIIFTESSSSSNRYPADMQPGMNLSGTSHKFSASYTWEEWKPETPTNPTSATSATSATNPTTATSSNLIDIRLGDVTYDKEVSLADVLAIQKAIIGSTTMNQTTKLRADIDGNGKINTSDVALILRYQVGYSDSYGIGTVMKIDKTKTVTI